jgi:hypothetical protein
MAQAAPFDRNTWGFELYSQVCQTGGKIWSKCDGGGLNPLALK